MGAGMSVVRILVAEAHSVCRLGLNMVISSQPGWSVCAEATTGVEAIEKTITLRPDVAVISQDLSLPNGFVAVLRIRRAEPSVEVVMVATHTSPQLAIEVLRAGARGLVLKSDPPQTVVAAIEAVRQHRTFLPPAVAHVALDELPRQPLSPRERDVARLIATGRSNKEVAAALGITPKTAETHRTRIMRKLELHSVVDLVHYAIRHGLIEIDWSG